jgi:two-component system cell cycle sensor histidine kinase/response regulator CckA
MKKAKSSPDKGSNWQKKLFRALFDNSPDPSFIVADDGIYVEVNDAAAAFLECTKTKAIGRARDEFVSEADDAFPDFEAPPWQKQDAVHVAYQVNGRRKGLLVTRVPLALGDKRAVLEIGKDVTDHIRIETELHESRERYRALVETTSDCLWEIDRHGVYLYMSPKSVGLFGYEPDEMAGKTPFDFMPSDEVSRVKDRFMTVLAAGRPFGPLASKGTRKDGGTFVVETTGVPVLGDNGMLMGYRGIDRDISERIAAEQKEKELSERLERAERMQSLGVLAGGVAHDLNNILGPLLMLPELVELDIARVAEQAGADLSEMTEDLGVIRTAAGRASVIIKDLVALGRRGNVHLHVADVNTMVSRLIESDDFIALQKERPQVELTTNSCETELPARISESHLLRVLINLVTNAAEAIDGNGVVAVSTHQVVLDTQLIGLEVVPAGEYAVIRVADTGCGMSREDMAHIFEPFFTTKRETNRSGSGLGLSVVHGIMKDHEGYVNVTSTKRKGTTFDLYLPLHAALRSGAAAESEEAPQGKGERVLVVDDEPVQRFMVRRALSALSYSVVETPNGREAVALFEKAKSAGEDSPFDLVLLDMIMQEDFDGLTTFYEILKRFPKQKVIIVTGHAAEDRGRAAQELGAGWLAKPYRASKLARSVRQKLDSG